MAEKGKGFAIGAVLGGIIGGAAVLLLTPQSGKKMRKKIAKNYKKVAHDARDLMENVCDSSVQLLERAQEIADKAESAAKECKGKYVKF